MIAAFARNPVAATLLMLAIMTLGLSSLPRLKQVTYPSPSLDLIAVHVAYPGATPEEVEGSLCIPLEEALYGVDGIERTSCLAREGAASLQAKLELAADATQVREDIQARVAALRNLPRTSEPPIVALSGEVGS